MFRKALLLCVSLLATSCMTNKKMLERAKVEVVGICLEEIEIKLMENHCHDIEFFRGRNQFVFRCAKPDNMRKNLWDTWWFRLTPSTMKHPPEKIDEIKEHTICIDGRHRLEAYPPDEQQ